jgi:predicted nucleotidyltransferase
LKTNSHVKESLVPVAIERITAARKDKSLHKRAPHISPHISRIIQRFVKDTDRLLQENVIAKYLFGSYATNTYTPHSDIDILIIVNTFNPGIRRQMSGLASEYSLEYDIYISPIIKDFQVWNKNMQFHTLFFQEVTQHGIQL